MRLTTGNEVTLIGVVITYDVVRPQSGGQPFVKAMVRSENATQVPVIWWDSGRAPRKGARVKVKGRVREYEGVQEVHAFEWAVERKGPPENPLSRIMGFYIGCVEAEAAGDVRFRPGSSGHVELTVGPSPVHGPRDLPLDKPIVRWCKQREMALGESIIAGWPMIIGVDGGDPGAGLVATPLLRSDVRLCERAGKWTVELEGSAVDLNPYALDLLGVDRDERDALVRCVEGTPAVEEARLPENRSAAILSALSEGGIAGLDGLDPTFLGPYDHREGVHNTGVLIVAAGSTRITRMLLGDLEEIVNSPNLLASGPASILMGLAPAPVASLPSPHPIVVPSTLVQDQAITSAMENAFTVVTGPPGTGKSQVLVNVVAAAVARGETVLFASKNNQAVDVVFSRLAQISKDACIVRAGASSRRGEVASSITKMLATPKKLIDLAAVRRNWIEVKDKVQAIYEVLHQRARLEGEIEQLKIDLRKSHDSLPDGINVDVDQAQLDDALIKARDALNAFGRRLGLFRRWSRHQQRLEQARAQLSVIGKLTGLSKETVYAPLSSVAEKPKRSLMPCKDFGIIEDILEVIASVKNTLAAIDQNEKELSGLSPKHELDDRLHIVGCKSTTAGRALLDSRWEQIRWDDPTARIAAGELAELLEKAANAGSGARRARGIVASALPAIPVWGITNLSARTNLPLVAGLFDLVVIDEASQCDVASAIPLLALTSP